MADNTVLPSGSGGDTIRDIAKTVNSPAKTQMAIIDIGGGADASPETAWTGAVTVTSGAITASGTVTANQGTANATPWNENIAQWGGATTTLGSKTSANSVPVVIASDQGAITVAQATPANLTATVTQGPAATAANAWTAKVTDGTTVAGVIAGTTALKTDHSSQAGTAITSVPVAFGTGTPSLNAPGVNAAAYVGTTPVRTNQTTTATGVIDVNIVGALGVTNSATNGCYSRLTDNTTAVTAAVSALGTAPTGTSVLAVNSVSLPSAAAGAACTLFQNSAVTTAVVVKASAGNVYGFMVNGGTSGNFLQFINASSAPVLGTAAVVSFQIPSTGILFLPAAHIAQFNNATGISVGISTTYNGAVAGTAAAVVVLYK